MTIWLLNQALPMSAKSINCIGILASVLFLDDCIFLTARQVVTDVLLRCFMPMQAGQRSSGRQPEDPRGTRIPSLDAESQRLQL